MTSTRVTDLTRSLEELDGLVSEEPDETDTIMVQRIYALRKKPLGILSDDEVRLAVSQRVGSPFILDLAFQRLEQEPLLDADCYPGDLLSALIRSNDDFWEGRPHLRLQLADLYAYAMAQPMDMTDSFRESLGLPVNDWLPS
jgi:hypothetical protein